MRGPALQNLMKTAIPRICGLLKWTRIATPWQGRGAFESSGLLC
jgi:hypothetical protein